MMRNSLFFSFLVFSLFCFKADAQTTGQAKVSHDYYDAMQGEYQGLVFDAIKPFTLIDVEIWSAGSGGETVIELHDNAGVVLESITVDIPGRASKENPIRVTVQLDWQINMDRDYRLLIIDSPELMYDNLPAVGGGYSYPIGSVGRVNSGFSESSNDNDHYYFFYNWTVQY